MTLNTTSTRDAATGDGSNTGPFTFDFYAQLAADVYVYLDGELQDSGYTVTLNDDDAGGVVNFTTAPADGVEILMIRIIEFTQGTGFTEENEFPEQAIEDMVDKAMMGVQQVYESGQRSLKLPITVDPADFNPEIPDPREFPGYLTVVNEDGDGFELKSPNTIINEVEGGGFGDITGPASAVDYEPMLFSGTTGKIARAGEGVGLANQIYTSQGPGQPGKFLYMSSTPFIARLSLETGVSYSTSDQLAKTTVYARGYQVPILVSGSTRFLPISGNQISKVLTGLSNTVPTDVFGRSAGGTEIDTLELVAFTSASARLVALTEMLGGIYHVHSSNTGWTWLGTIMGSASGQCEDSTKFSGLWNFCEQIEKPMYCVDTTNSWTYALTTNRSFNGNTTAGVGCVKYVIGMLKQPQTFDVTGIGVTQNGNPNLVVGVGVNSVTTDSSQIRIPVPGGNTAGFNHIAKATYKGHAGLGFNTVSPIERCTTAASVTILGDNNDLNNQSGMMGTIYR